MTTVIQALANLKTAIEAGDTNTALENLSELTALGNLSELTALGDLSELTALGDLSELTALGDIATIKSTLSSWQPYLKYLQNLSGQAALQGETLDNLTEIQLTSRCKAVNYIFDQVLNVIDILISQDVEAYSDVAGAISAGLIAWGTAAIVDGPLPFGDLGGVLLGAATAVIVLGADLDAIKTNIELNRSDIIADLYNAVDTYDCFNAYQDNMTLSTAAKVLLKTLLFGSLLKTMYVDGFEYPAGYTPRVATPCTSADCANPNERQLTTFWGLGTPSLLSGDQFVSGSTNSQWDYVTNHVAFGCMNDPIGSMTINSISSASVDYMIEQCDGNEISVNEALAGSFPLTFTNVVYVSISRDSSSFTVNITFS